ncbi:MAG TPA: hypothetical protein VMP01_22495 [Pirellulaceae bacterium]|nr:hypothetical protein [Pirellulaceae bacterium]
MKRILSVGRPFQAVVIVAMVAMPALAQQDSDVFRRKQQAQEKARALAGELVNAVLDIQLRQLAENGLAQRAIYKDIASMKGNIGLLMKEDMETIVQLLVQAQEGTQEERLAKFNEARGKIREVVVQLMAERQKLYRRMQIARLAAQVRELIAVQTKTRAVTRSLPERKLEERERLTLTTIEDQADVQKFFYQLVATLEDVATWGGQVGAGASDGLRIVKAAQVDAELRRAGATLAKSEISQAADAQTKVIAGLKRLLEKLEETQGLIESDREAAIRMVREMMKKQEQVREQTKVADLAQPEIADQQTAAQQQIHEELGKLSEALARYESAQPLLEQAKASAFEAQKELFEQQKEPALDSQSEVIGALAKVEQDLLQGIDLDKSDKSADELAERVRQLEEAAKALEAAAKEQAKATEMAAQKPAEAKAHEQKTAAELAKVEALPELPSVVDAAMNRAQEEVAEATAALDNPAADADMRVSQAEEAMDAIERAQAEVAAQLADARRQQKAVEVGELARAAEALERAAAAERQVAAEAMEAAKTDGLDAKQADALASEQMEVATVAAKIAEGVKNTAPEAAQMLADAAQPIGDAAKAIDAAKEQPGEASKPSAEQAAQAAKDAAEKLAAAAKELREQAGESAAELAQIAGEQLAQAEVARAAVDQAAANAADSKAEAVAKLEQAQQKVHEAKTAQAKAEGKAEAAAAQSLVEKIAGAIEQQGEADAAASDLAKGKSNSPLQAAIEQQEVAEQAGQIAEEASGDTAQSLQAAAKNAAEAAKEMLAGNPAADAARAAAKEALAEAMKSAQAAAEEAGQLPAGKPDPTAQAEAGQAAAEAAQLAGEAAQQAGTPAQEAGEAAGEAAKQAMNAAEQLKAGEMDAAKTAQAEAGKALDQAGKKIDEALANLAKEQSQQLAADAQTAGKLAEQAQQIDPGATAALEQAEDAAAEGAIAGEVARQAAEAMEAVKNNLERAAANLAAREQQLRRDRDIAEALAELAQEQQAARDAIDQAAEQLAQMADQSEGVPPTSAQVAAAQALGQATQEFAQAQRATGQGAVEVSGQTEVANVPVREGLQAASQLGGLAAAPMPMGEGQPAGEGQPVGKGEPAEGTPMGEGQLGEGQLGEGQLGEGQGQPMELGTGFVPESPEATANQIAGQQALSQAAQTLAQAVPSPDGTPMEGAGEGEPMPGKTSPMAKKGGASKSGDLAENQKAQEGPLELAPAGEGDSRGEKGSGDSDTAGQKYEDEPWFAKLPPALQSAIQAKARGKAPRGYEERLKRYFESVE